MAKVSSNELFGSSELVNAEFLQEGDRNGNESVEESTPASDKPSRKRVYDCLLSDGSKGVADGGNRGVCEPVLGRYKSPEVTRFVLDVLKKSDTNSAWEKEMIPDVKERVKAVFTEGRTWAHEAADGERRMSTLTKVVLETTGKIRDTISQSPTISWDLVKKDLLECASKQEKALTDYTDEEVDWENLVPYLEVRVAERLEDTLTLYKRNNIPIGALIDVQFEEKNGDPYEKLVAGSVGVSNEADSSNSRPHSFSPSDPQG